MIPHILMSAFAIYVSLSVNVNTNSGFLIFREDGDLATYGWYNPEFVVLGAGCIEEAWFHIIAT